MNQLLPEGFVPPTMSPLKRTLLFLVILFAGVAGMQAIASADGKSSRKSGSKEAQLVATTTVQSVQIQSVIESTSTLTAAQQIRLVPEVSGRITWVSSKLQPGATFKAGEEIARIETSTYDALLAQDTVRLKQAELELALEEERSKRAAQDWERLGNPEQDGRLASRTHHLELAQANLAAAQASHLQSQKNLNRTRLRAPFNAVIVQEYVDVGQVVGPGVQVADLAGTDRFRAIVHLPVKDLTAIAIPGVDGNSATEGSSAILSGGTVHDTSPKADARVSGMAGQLDPMTKMAGVLLDVKAPKAPQTGTPLLLGGIYTVKIQGKTKENGIRIPRSALYEGNKVWVVDAEETMQVKIVQTGWDLGDHIEITEGLDVGEQIIVSPMSLPIIGTPVRIMPSGEEG